MQVEIFHDVICPWCWIGKRRFEWAVEAVDVPIEITWRPFRLDPNVAPGGGDFATAMRAKFPGMDLDRMFHQMRERGLADGLDMRYDRITKRFDTFDAHRLEAIAHDAGFADAVVEGLFVAYFTDGADLSDADILAGIGADAGLDRDEVRAALDGDTAKESVLEQLARGLELGITGVPYFVFDNRLAVGGAQDVDTFVRAIGRALEV